MDIDKGEQLSESFLRIAGPRPRGLASEGVASSQSTTRSTPTATAALEIAGCDVSDAPLAARKISMVFQSYALFPHLDTRENILFGSKVRRVPSAERGQRLARVVEMVGLEGLLDRKPSQFSGGQRQRVALARAIVAENHICLMDEPLSNLDACGHQVTPNALDGKLG